MTEPSIFIGVVSYEGSRFTHNQGDSGLAAQLGAALRERGCSVQIVVDTQNRWNADSASISSEQVQAALTAQVQLEDRWVAYLNEGRVRNARQLASSVLRWARRGVRRVAQPDAKFLVRLLNIELAHRALLQQGVNSRSDWILILEDDASSSDIADLAGGLVTLLRACEASVQFINVSESFAPAELGIAHVLKESNLAWFGSAERSVLLADRPVTNTVCAMAYRSSFAARLLNEFNALPLFPVVPIDWRLNEVLMAMFEQGELGAGSCASVVPGPIEQLSMQASP